MLIDLCHNTEPDVDKLNGHKTNHIFSAHTIDAHELYRKTKQEYGYNDHFEVGTIMKQANTIWKLRKRWEAADENNQQKDYYTFGKEVEMMNDIDGLLKSGNRISAIKLYRSEMKDIYGMKVGLKECKDFIDSFYDDKKD